MDIQANVDSKASKLAPKTSRVGKRPVELPKGVTAAIGDRKVEIKGPKGQLVRAITDQVDVKVDAGKLVISSTAPGRDGSRLQGLARALINGMVNGAANGYTKTLQLVGTGYRVQSQGAALNLSLGFSHPVVYKLPEGVKAETPTQNEILIKGADKQKVGQVAAEIRAHRPPEPYKGKGVRYSNEVVSLKEVKKK